MCTWWWWLWCATMYEFSNSTVRTHTHLSSCKMISKCSGCDRKKKRVGFLRSKIMIVDNGNRIAWTLSMPFCQLQIELNWIELWPLAHEPQQSLNDSYVYISICIHSTHTHTHWKHILLCSLHANKAIILQPNELFYLPNGHKPNKRNMIVNAHTHTHRVQNIVGSPMTAIAFIRFDASISMYTQLYPCKLDYAIDIEMEI